MCVSVQSLSLVRLFATPWIAARQASLSITNSRSLFKLLSIELVMPSNHLILYRPLLLLPSVFPSIRVFFNESVLHSRWPKYWSFSFGNSPSNEYSGLISFRMDWSVSCIKPGLAICFTYDNIHVSMLFSQVTPPSPSPKSPKDCSIHLCLFCCLTYRVIITIFLNSIYMCECTYWCFPFWLTSLCIIGSSFIHLIRTDSNVFFLMAV